MINQQTMEKMKKLESVTQFNIERGQETLHPLVTVLDQTKSKLIKPSHFISDIYVVFLKEEKCADLLYGRSHYDYQEESLIFIAPGQLAGFEDTETLIQPNGWALAFHPDFINGTTFGKHIGYSGRLDHGIPCALDQFDVFGILIISFNSQWISLVKV